MVIGRTSNTISKAEVFSKYSESEVLSSVFPEIKSLPCLICSPLRVDCHPSFSIYVNDSGNIRFKDHATRESGSLLDLLCAYWHCTFNQALDKIISLHLDGSLTVKPKKLKTLTRREVDSSTKIQVSVRPWHDYDYQYWASYGIEKPWLRYAEIYPISHKIVTKKPLADDWSSAPKTYIFPADKYAYCFVERKEGNLSIKVYQPYNKHGFKWCSKMDGSVISLWTKVPKQGDCLIICSSVKDALCVSCQLGIPAIAPQGEGYGLSQTATNELKRRFKHVYIAFDTDAPGIADAQKLSEQTGFPYIVPDLGTSKDFSDYYKSLQNKEDFKLLKKYFPAG